MADQTLLGLCAPRSSASAPDRHENYVEQFLHLWVPHLCILEDLSNKVHRLLLDFHRGFCHFMEMTVLTNVSVATTYSSSISLGRG
jgi:hypothetical protein